MIDRCEHGVKVGAIEGCHKCRFRMAIAKSFDDGYHAGFLEATRRLQSLVQGTMTRFAHEETLRYDEEQNAQKILSDFQLTFDDITKEKP